TMFMMARKNYILRAAGLFSNLQLFIITSHEESREWLKENFPEFFRIGFKEQFDRGIPLPSQTIDVKIPPIKETLKKVDFEGWDYQWPKGNFIHLEDLGISTVEEALDGVLLDITHHNPPNTKVTPKNIISRGMGKNTKFLK
ncbi:MAG: hypothetical protein ACTSVY_06630, partial [Candidatus Helarchaeota archaeon]